MKKLLLVALAFSFTVASVDAQRVLLDFENYSQEFGECFGNGSQAVDGCHAVIANPDASGINTSANVGEFIEPGEGEPWMGMFFEVTQNGTVDLTTAGGNTQICADVWTPAAGNTFTFKVEDHDGTAVVSDFEGLPQPIAEASTWVTVCDNMAAFNSMANRLVLFFNIGSTPTATTTHYFDNVTQPGATSVNGLIAEKGLEVYPNPATYNLLFNADGEPMTVIVSDVAGREMFRHTNYTDNNIRVADLTPGLYVVTFVDEATGRFGSTKFMKK